MPPKKRGVREFLNKFEIRLTTSPLWKPLSLVSCIEDVLFIETTWRDIKGDVFLFFQI